MFKNLTVKAKLSFLVGGMVVGLVAVGLIGWRGMPVGSLALHEVNDVRLPSILGLEVLAEARTDIRLRTIETAIWENDYRAQGNFADSVERKNKAWERAQAGWKIYEPLPQTPEGGVVAVELLGDSSGLAMSRTLAGESPAWVTVSHEPSIQPCCSLGNRRVDA